VKPYYENENGKLYNAHNVDFCKTIPDNYFDLTVTSPPYDNLRDYKGFSFDFKGIARELFRVTKKGGVVVWVVNDSTIKGSESGTSFKQALYFKEIGFNLHDTMFYHKVGLTLNHNRYEQEIEYMFVFSKGKPKTFNPIKIPCIWYNKDSDRTGQKTKTHNEKNCKLRSGNNRNTIKQNKIKGNIWKYNTGGGHSTKDKIAFKHPAIFPEQLARDHIVSWSNMDDIVFDPFAGSGTTLKMAEENNRTWLGCEQSKEYCEIAAKRIEAENRQLKMF